MLISLSAVRSASQSAIQDKVACLKRIKQLIKSRIHFNYQIANYFNKVSCDEGLFFIANHLYKEESQAYKDILALLFANNQTKQENIDSHQKACRGDGNNFGRLLPLFKYSDMDFVFVALFNQCQIMIRLLEEDEQQRISERSYYLKIQKLILPFINRDLFIFCIQHRKTSYTPPVTYQHQLEVAALETILKQAKMLEGELKKIDKPERYVLKQNVTLLSRLLYQTQSYTDEDLNEALFAAFVLMQLNQKYDLLITAQQEALVLAVKLQQLMLKENEKKGKKDPDLHVELSEEEDNEVQCTVGEQIDSQEEEEGKELGTEVYLTYSYQYQRQKKKIGTEDQQQLQAAARLEYYRDLLKRQKDLLFLIFRENTPHLEIGWDEIERLFTLLNVKMKPGAGSRITLVFSENTIHETWVDILKPIEFSQRGIHKSHKPNRSGNLIANIYVEIIQSALLRFKLDPYQLWPQTTPDKKLLGML